MRHRIPAFRKPTSLLYREMKPEVCTAELEIAYFDWAMDWIVRSSIPGWTKNVSFLPTCPHWLSGPPSPHSMSTVVLCLEAGQLGCEVDCSPPSSVKVTNEWSYTFNFPVCLHGQHRDDVTFHLRVPVSPFYATINLKFLRKSEPLSFTLKSPRSVNRHSRYSQIILFGYLCLVFPLGKVAWFSEIMFAFLFKWRTL
jgi:hypothetical protein